ncbi:MAG TPA: helix-turn-helix transcriptional regulator [Bryobacteraceae bacterium]|jgi:transcriptional regulator with XRE-family HTH domain
MTIGEAVRSLRKRSGKNQKEFASVLGCQPNTVSRYELGIFPPGPLVLINLLHLAESASFDATVEKGVINGELKALYDRGLIGGGRSADETIALMSSVSAAMLRQGVIGHQLMDILPEKKRREFGPQFMPAVAHVIEACDTVDQSVADILQLWAAHSRNKEATQYFREALGFLRGQLWVRRSHATSRRG